MILQMLKKRIIKYQIGYFMAVIFIFYSFGYSYAATRSSTSIIASSNYSDIEVFKGVMFLEGRVADLLPEFKDFKIDGLTSDKKVVEATHAFQERVIENFNKKYPSYFTDFHKKIVSGDFDLVSATIKDASGKLLLVVSELSGKSTSDIEKMASSIASQYQYAKGAGNEMPLKKNKGLNSEIDNGIAIIISVLLIVFVALALVVSISNDYASNNYYMDNYYTKVTLNLKNV